MKLEQSIITFESLRAIVPPRLSVAWLSLKFEFIICAVVFLRYAAPAIGDVLLMKMQFLMMLLFPFRNEKNSQKQIDKDDPTYNVHTLCIYRRKRQGSH